MQFWQRFLERVHAEYPSWTKARRTGPENWYELKSPITGCGLNPSFAQHDRLRHELYIDTGDGERNMEIFNALHGQKDQLEAAYGGPLTWEELSGRRACRIADYRDGCSVVETERHDEFINWFLDCGARLRRALNTVELPA